MLDANTFTNNKVIEYQNQYFVNLKVDASTEYGISLFDEFNGNGYPMLLFLDNNKNEVDRFYGYLEPKEFLEKVKQIKDGENIFPNLLTRYNAGDYSPENLSLLAEKYNDRGNDSLASELYNLVLQSRNLPLDLFHKAKYYIDLKLLWNENSLNLENYISNHDDSPYLLDAVNQLLAYYKMQGDTNKELFYFNNYIEQFSDNPWFLNQYSWRMSELNINLNDALEKVEYALEIFNENDIGIDNIIDTKAELLWKLGMKDKAIAEIQNAIKIDPDNQYYKEQKNKFLQEVSN